jgi:hypothetical protein
MAIIKKLIKQYTELWKEYEEFLRRNKLEQCDVVQVCFIYYDRHLNKNCLKYKADLTQEECCMYNLTVDDDSNWILTDNGFGTIYVKLTNNTIFGFRCTEQCMKAQNYRFINQWIMITTNLSEKRYALLEGMQFF